MTNIIPNAQQNAIASSSRSPKRFSFVVTNRCYYFSSSARSAKALPFLSPTHTERDRVVGRSFWTITAFILKYSLPISSTLCII